MEHEFIHTPDAPNGSAIVLTHGAGGNCRSELLIRIADALCATGMLVLRCDLAFRRQRPFGPPFPPGAAADRATLREAVKRLRETATGPIYLGGHSYGGRQASMLAAEEPKLADGLFLLSYPLHPPNKPAQLRTQHFAQLLTPALFVHGTKDPFGIIEEMKVAMELIPANTQLMVVERAGHDLKKGKFDLKETALLLGRSSAGI